MIITVLRDKYNCGSNRGISCIEIPGLLTKLNTIINWDFCTFPKKLDDNNNEIEERDFLGNDPELKVGDMFLLNGNVLAFDSKDKLVLCLSESGMGAVQRIYDELIDAEFDLAYNYTGVNVNFQKDEITNIPENYVSWSVPYYLMKLFKDNYVKGRDYPEKNLCIKTEMDSDNYIMPVTIYILDWTIKYDPLYLEEDQLEDSVKELFSYFYNKFPPIIEKKEEVNEENNEKS